MMLIQAGNGQARAIVPYHPAFTEKMRELQLLLCDSTGRCWNFSSEYIPVVRNAMEAVYGESDIKAGGKHYNVQLMFQKDVEGPTDGLCLYGKCLAFAFPQAKKVIRGAGVCFAKGGCKFGQTEEGRSIVIGKETVAILYNVPESLLHREKVPDGVTVKAFERTLESLRLTLEKEIMEKNRENSGADSLVPDISDEASQRNGRGWNRLDFLRFNSSGMLYLQEDGCPRFHSMFDAITKRWPEGTTIEDAAAELEAAGWERLPEKAGRQTDHIDFYHIPTQMVLLQHLQELSQRELDELYERPALDGDEIRPGPEIPGAEHVYIRFGEPPKYGYSVNHSKALPEFGVSCFEAVITPDGNCQFVNRNNRLYIELLPFFHDPVIAALPAYRVYGDLIGVGSDGEPLLRVTKFERFQGKCLEPEATDEEQDAVLECITQGRCFV